MGNYWKDMKKEKLIDTLHNIGSNSTESAMCEALARILESKK